MIRLYDAATLALTNAKLTEESGELAQAIAGESDERVASHLGVAVEILEFAHFGPGVVIR